MTLSLTTFFEGQVKNFDKSNFSDTSEIFSPMFLHLIFPILCDVKYKNFDHNKLQRFSNLTF